MAPWEKFDPADQPVIVKPCPPCKHPVSRQCKGGHETSEMACFEARSYECGLRCGRQLPCGNHTCQRGCHVVVNPPDDIMVLLCLCSGGVTSVILSGWRGLSGVRIAL